MTRATALRAIRWSALVAVIVLPILIAIGVVLERPGMIKERIEHALSDRLHLDATLARISWTIGQGPRLHGEKLELRLPDRPDLPPFIAIDRFWVEAGPIGVLRGHVGTVHVEGLRIVVPPGDAKHQAMHSMPHAGTSKVVVDHLVTMDSELRILRKDPAKAPTVFRIHSLEMDDLGFDRPIPFTTKLTNPVPTGEVTSHGSVGPWTGAPSDLPIEGTYDFAADLDTIAGIGGLLKSAGKYDGRIGEIHVQGTTDTPDFSLDLGGHAVPLHTTFTAVVDGSNGSTRLDKVNAHILQTDIHVRGEIVNQPGPTGFDFQFNAEVTHGRVQDVTRLVIDDATPIARGPIQLTCSVTIPNGHGPFQKRLRASGHFALDRTTFASVEVRRKIDELSQRGSGEWEGHVAEGDVASAVSGGFRLSEGVLTLSALSFRVPGATVALAGSYTLDTHALDLTGELQLLASASDAVGGFKSIFLKPFDWLFHRGKHGTVIPIKVGGTPDKPAVGVRMGALLSRGK